MHIRDATADDATDLVPLFDELGHPADAAALGRRLARLEGDPTYAAWVVEADAGLAGFAAAQVRFSLTSDDPVAQLVALVTAPGSGDSGIGSALLAHFERWARGHGVHRVLLTSATHRAAAHRFYEHRGFTATGLRLEKSL